MDDLLAEFLTETLEGLTALDAALVRLERAPGDRDTLGEVFRIVHTVKGTCGFLGLTRLEAVSHAAENVLGRYRDGTLTVDQAGISLILRAMDAMRAITAALHAGGAEPQGSDAALIAALAAAAEGTPTAAVTERDPAPTPATAPALVPEAPAAGVAPQTIRVAVDVLENLMVLVSELVLTRNQLQQIVRNRADPELGPPLQRLSHLTSELQEGVMKTRMQPIGNAWAKLPRLVRDLGIELDKRIELVMRGAETELDRQVLELIRDPLTHMVRNSADHGLETPAERRRANKHEVGRITLAARHEGGHIIIALSDDGRGLNTVRIREKLLAQGLATEAELAVIPERELHRFIFHPGFSTAAAVTAVSGRGVGMDVVRTNIERIGGVIDLRSEAGAGTAFEIKIPLTLAIVAALIVQAGGERFAVPQLGVTELVRLGHATGPETAVGKPGPGDGARNVERIKNAAVLRLRDRLLPLVDLGDLLHLDRAATEPAEPRTIVVMGSGNEAFGIIVDRVFDTEEIVVKPVAPILRHVTLFSGNTILGDGSVIMILDPNGIARAAGLLGAGREPVPERDVPTRPQTDRNTALLLFRAGEPTPRAVPLALVARIESLPTASIERAGGRPVVQYRGRLMPLVPLAGDWDAATAPANQPVLVFDDEGRAMGLMVDEILDVLEAPLSIDPAGARPGCLGAAVIAGRVTQMLDTAWWLARANADWFGTASRAGPASRILVVEDSAFFRNLVGPALTAAGHRVTAVADARAALALRDAGEGFDAIVSDIEMPDLDGYAFARAVREGGAWRDLPLIALSGRTTPTAIEAGRVAGFTDWVAKFDRAGLLDSLRACVTAPAG